MFLYRKRALVLHLITFGLAFAIGCLITLSVVNIKRCENEFEHMQSTADPKQSASSIFLVIVILSAPKNVDQRNVIRQSWLNLKPKINEPLGSDFVLNDLEFDQHGFLLQDTRYNLSAKLAACRFQEKIDQIQIQTTAKRFRY